MADIVCCCLECARDNWRRLQAAEILGSKGPLMDVDIDDSGESDVWRLQVRVRGADGTIFRAPDFPQDLLNGTELVIDNTGVEESKAFRSWHDCRTIVMRFHKESRTDVWVMLPMEETDDVQVVALVRFGVDARVRMHVDILKFPLWARVGVA